MDIGPTARVPSERRSSLLASLSLLALTTPSLAEDAAVASVARGYARTHDFHGTVLVERRGETLFHEGFGLADREFDVPVQKDTKFKVASITKAFTSVLILQLKDQGKLNLDATFKSYLPGYPGVGADQVTIHQLLNHTSGLANYDTALSDDEAEKRGLELYQLPHTTDQILERLSRGKPTREPGTAFDYNNLDYVILGKVIEALTGQPYEVVLGDRLLNPLGMAETGMLHHASLTKKLARTYWKPKGNRDLTNDWPMYPENWYSAGGMFSTALDLQKFADSLFAGKLLRPESLALLLKPGLDDYGYGAWIRSRKVGGTPDRVFERYGSIQGANSILSHALGADITVILLSNTNATNLGDFSARLGNAASGRRDD